MTAYAIDFRKTRAVVASDTLSYAPDRREVVPLGFINKVLPFPHLKAVLFSRGQVQIIASVYAGLLTVPQILDLEDLVTALPASLRFATQAYAMAQGIEDPVNAGLLEVVLIGWSERHKRMRAFQFLNMREYIAEDAGECYGLLSFPRLPAEYQPKAQGQATDRDLVRVIQAADKWFTDQPELNCGMRVGGEIVATNITPMGMSTRTIHRFADYDAVRHASAAIVQRIMRGDVDMSTAVRDGLVPVDEMVDSETGEKLKA